MAQNHPKKTKGEALFFLPPADGLKKIDTIALSPRKRSLFQQPAKADSTLRKTYHQVTSES
jgi:hypothetical protein